MMDSMINLSSRMLYKSEHDLEHFTFEHLIQTLIFLSVLWVSNCHIYLSKYIYLYISVNQYNSLISFIFYPYYL
jgi:hypothetical protein